MPFKDTFFKIALFEANLLVNLRKTSLFLLACLCLEQNMSADNFKVAVASNFKGSLEQLQTAFYQTSQHRFLISSGSSGILYAQILAGAPFDIFLSADTERPQELLAKGSAKEVFTYATGQLVLWIPQSQINKDQGTVNGSYLKSFRGKLAIANPVTAPYGKAALGVIQQLGLTNQLSLIKGNNISQAYQFVETAGADAGFVSYSQLLDQCKEGLNCWKVPQSLHQPINQQVALLSPSNPGAVEFFTFLQSPQARHIIISMGYWLEDRK